MLVEQPNSVSIVLADRIMLMYVNRKNKVSPLSRPVLIVARLHNPSGASQQKQGVVKHPREEETPATSQRFLFQLLRVWW